MRQSKPKTTVSIRTVQRLKAAHRATLKRLEASVIQARHVSDVAEQRANALAQYSALPERLERIQSIVEEIIAFHGLAPEIREELMQAVHQAIASRRTRPFVFRRAVS